MIPPLITGVDTYTIVGRVVEYVGCGALANHGTIITGDMGVVPCVVYITAASFTTTLQHLWANNLKRSNCTLRFFSNDALLESSNELGVGEYVRALRPWAYRADVWRYAQLLHTGGMFFDAEIQLVRPPEEIFDLDSRMDLQLIVDMNPRCYFQAVMAASMGSGGLALVLNRTISNIQGRTYGYADGASEPWLGITGKLVLILTWLFSLCCSFTVAEILHVQPICW